MNKLAYSEWPLLFWHFVGLLAKCIRIVINFPHLPSVPKYLLLYSNIILPGENFGALSNVPHEKNSCTYWPVKGQQMTLHF